MFILNESNGTVCNSRDPVILEPRGLGTRSAFSRAAEPCQNKLEAKMDEIHNVKLVYFSWKSEGDVRQNAVTRRSNLQM